MYLVLQKIDADVSLVQMDEKDSVIKELKRELAHTQLNISKSGKDSHKKLQGTGKTGKSLDGWKENEYLATIKQLRAQVCIYYQIL